MTDDDRLATLFHAAASDAGAPEAGFDHTDVVRGSRRVTARRRRAVLIGASALFVLVGVGAAVVVPDYSQDALTTAAAPESVEAPRAASGGAASDGSTGAGSESGGAAAGSQVPDAVLAAPSPGPPLGPGTATCADRQDPRLRRYVEQVLPEVAGAPAAATPDVCLPGDQRYVTLEVDDAGATGVLVVGYLPPGAVVDPAPGTLSAPTASGGTVLVNSRPAAPGGAVPFEGRLDTAVAFLAARL